MGWRIRAISAWVLLAGVAALGTATSGRAIAGGAPQAQPQTTSSTVRAIGAVQSVQGNTLILKTDSGSEVNVQVQDSARIVRVAAGQKTLSGATPIHLQGLQVGDRVLASGKNSEDGKTLLASSVIVMKRVDVEQKQQQEEMEWQKNGVGGLVKTVDASTKTITVSTRIAGAAKMITVHTAPNTILRRYAPDSVRFQDAKLGTFDQIKPGDQLRARGTLNADSSELNAVEIVSGTFRNIAGTIISVDPSENEITVTDLIAKQPVAVKVTASSQMRALPEVMAQRIAMQLKGGSARPPSAGGEQEPASTARRQRRQYPGGEGPQNQPAGSHPDFDQIMNRLPQVQLSDLHKGDAVMIVSAEGVASDSVTAIKLVSGVAPILTASPSKNRAAMLQSLWSGFSTSGGGEEPSEGGGGGENGGGGARGPDSR